ncbi:MAG: ArnT family glycosyltransferase [Akkermansia sp.]
MSSAYFVRRLAPFLAVYGVYECLELAAQAAMGGGGVPGVLGLLLWVEELLASFCFCVLPFVLYLAALPRGFHGGRADRAVTCCLFALFCAVNAAEELAEVLSGDTLQLMTAAMVAEPAAQWARLAALPGLLPGAPAAAVVVLLSLWGFVRCPWRVGAVPSAGWRLATALGLAGLGFVLLHASQGLGMEEAAQPLYRDGMISLFGGLFALDRVPNLRQIFAPPCLGLLLAAGAFAALNALCVRRWGAARSPMGCLRRCYAGLCRRRGRLLVGLVGLLALVLLLRLVSLGLYPLMDTTEARYAEMARKMLETGQWLQPQFDYGVPFWGKPPLSFWASAGSMLLFGVHAFGARVAPFVCMLLVGLCCALWPFGTRRAEQATASALVLLSSAMGFVAAGAVMTDAFLTLGVVLVMLSFRRVMLGGGRVWGYLFFVGLGLGLLSKGPLVLVLCGAPLGLAVCTDASARAALRRLPWVGGALLLLPVAGWYAAAEWQTPGYLRYFLLGEHVERFLVRGWQGDLYGSGHARVPGTIWLYALEMALPWSLLLPLLLHRAAGAAQAAERRYLTLWCLCPLVFFTPARNVLPAYVLPMLPPLALLLVRELWERREGAYRHLVLLPLPLMAVAALFMLGSGFGQIAYRCDRDLLAGHAAGQPVYYAGERPAYSGCFYTGGAARKLRTEPAALPPGAWLVTPVGAPAPGEDWRELRRSYRSVLWQKSGAAP